jgi:outer membrane immunogenic protein
MKRRKLLALTLLLATGFAETGFAQTRRTQNAKPITVTEDVDTLGGNEELMKMAQSLKSRTRARIVQERIVDRRNRLEVGLVLGSVLGGDSYLKTQSTGVNLHWHFTPRWSLGVQYNDYSNQLTPEGKRVFDLYRRTQNAGGTPAYAVDVDFPLNSTLAVVNWYPIYGKTSFLDLGITQFDLYFLAGAGQVQLSSGPTSSYAAGFGVGAWLSRHLTLRGEVRYQTYQDRPVTGPRNLDTGHATFSIGWIL